MSETPEHLDPNTPEYLEPHSSRGLFLRRLDQAQARKEDCELIRWLLIGAPFFLLVLLISSCVSSFTNATTSDLVQIQELNWRLFDNPDIPFEDEENHVYTTVNSIAEAEDWLLDHGYTCRQIHTKGWYEYNGEYKSFLKTFPVKGRALSLSESVVMLKVDFGDGDLHRLPFRTWPGESCIDFSRFENSWNGEKPKHLNSVTTLAFEMGFMSTHNWGNKARFSHRLEYNWPAGGYDIEKHEESRKEAREKEAEERSHRQINE